MDNNNKNLLLATLLSFVVIVVWFVLFPPPEPVTDPNASVTTEDRADPASPGGLLPASDGGTNDATAAGTEAPADSAPRITIKTPSLDGAISLRGGRLDQLLLKNYRKTLDPESPEVEILSPIGNENPYYALYGWAASGGLSADAVPGPDTLWQAPAGAEITTDRPVTLEWSNGAGLTFRREISVDANFMFTITQSVENTGADAVTLHPYGLIRRHGTPSNLKKFFVLHEGLIRMSDGELQEEDYKGLTKFDIDDREGAPADRIEVAESGWIGFTDHYWMTTLIPEGAFRSTAKYFEAQDIFQTEAVMPAQSVAPGATVAVTSRLFAGAKEWETIRDYQDKAGVVRFIDAIDWGWFFFLTKPIFSVLHWLHSFIGNMGWSIIALTFLLKLILFPLAYKSYASMARMKELQPEMEKIKEKAGDDRQKVQQEMMALYKKKKVNPAAGCLPILLQIPIFFSLYKVIFVTLELRHAPWIGWIRDLSAPDPSSILNLFGLLPFAAPDASSPIAIISLGILPILLGISMWLQQKLNPAPTDATQAMIFAWMPWVFMFMLGSFASGLVIYWITNNTITFTQQYIIMRSHGYHPDVFGNIRKSFRRKKPAEGGK
ncbi:membrane protein insertase YidC [Pseudooceanicola sp.]|uniref:membrane protein insertase YidC n=1 Tax=Pseudooceanicola sp. TaxID=1914328 RepID=UPI0026366197|nr:membrane protein insertase YidC [Pseudooceanicola sp.]MDF1856946.1 membrane protein insertase YidC [Pseudooceanicola sp.]